MCMYYYSYIEHNKQLIIINYKYIRLCAHRYIIISLTNNKSLKEEKIIIKRTYVLFFKSIPRKRAISFVHSVFSSLWIWIASFFGEPTRQCITPHTHTHTHSYSLTHYFLPSYKNEINVFSIAIIIWEMFAFVALC